MLHWNFAVHQNGFDMKEKVGHLLSKVVFISTIVNNS
jgi:hypothetical protein